MTHTAEYTDVLKAVSVWPVEQRIALAHDVLETLTETPASERRRPSFERALGIGSAGPVTPDDDEVRRWIDEHRTEKYG